MSGSAHALIELSYPQVQALLAAPNPSIALVPAGSVEAHGPHLPLGTDTLISDAVAARAAERLAHAGYVAVRFPPVHYGVTDWARSFSGTVSWSSEVVHDAVLQTCLEAHRIGFEQVVITNAHLEPGHIATLRRVATSFEAETGRPLLFVDKTRRKAAARLTAEFQSGSCHAGQYETSLVLAIRPDLVDTHAAAVLPEHVVPLHEKIAAGARDFAECGLEQAYCGKPSAATADEGRATLETLATLVVEAVQASA
jgi:creatinine amidohydrolase